MNRNKLVKMQLDHAIAAAKLLCPNAPWREEKLYDELAKALNKIKALSEKWAAKDERHIGTEGPDFEGAEMRACAYHDMRNLNCHPRGKYRRRENKSMAKQRFWEKIEKEEKEYDRKYNLQETS